MVLGGGEECEHFHNQIRGRELCAGGAGVAERAVLGAWCGCWWAGGIAVREGQLKGGCQRRMADG